jgi:hypothetical protein
MLFGEHMRTILSGLCAALLAVAAAGCDDTTDCPGAVSQGASCTAAGLTCYAGVEQCTCSGGTWSCKPGDMSIHVFDEGLYDLAHPTTD